MILLWAWDKMPMASPLMSKPLISRTPTGLAAFPIIPTQLLEPLAFLEICLCLFSVVVTTPQITPVSATPWMKKDYGHHLQKCLKRGKVSS